MPNDLMSVSDDNTIWINNWHNYVLMELFYYHGIPPYICFEFREYGEPLLKNKYIDIGDCSESKEEKILDFLNSVEFRHLHRIRAMVPGARIRADYFERIDGVWEIKEKSSPSDLNVATY